MEKNPLLVLRPDIEAVQLPMLLHTIHHATIGVNIRPGQPQRVPQQHVRDDGPQLGAVLARDLLLCGETWGKRRALVRRHQDEKVEAAGLTV